MPRLTSTVISSLRLVAIVDAFNDVLGAALGAWILIEEKPMVDAGFLSGKVDEIHRGEPLFGRNKVDSPTTSPKGERNRSAAKKTLCRT